MKLSISKLLVIITLLFTETLYTKTGFALSPDDEQSSANSASVLEVLDKDAEAKMADYQLRMEDSLYPGDVITADPAVDEELLDIENNCYEGGSELALAQFPSDTL